MEQAKREIPLWIEALKLNLAEDLGKWNGERPWGQADFDKVVGDYDVLVSAQHGQFLLLTKLRHFSNHHSCIRTS
jgi:hypothetical protein